MPSLQSASLFVDTQQVAQSVEFASYISKCKGETEECHPFLDEAQKLVLANNPGGLYNLLVRESGVLFSAPDKEFEGAYNLLFALFQHVPKEVRRNLVKPAIKTIAESSVDKVSLKLKVLSNLYNILAPNDPLRYDVYLGILAFAVKSNELEKLSTHLPNLETWAREWGISLDQIRELLLDVSDKLEKQGLTKDAFSILVKHLRSYDDAGAASALPVARRMVSLAISTPSILAFEDIYSLPAVQLLQGSREGKDKALHGLIRVFLQGDLAVYREFANSKEGAALANDGTFRKMKLLTLASLGAKHVNEELPYARVAEALQIDEGEIESWIIEVIREGLVEAKMNQLNETVTISRSTYRTFERGEWEELAGKLHAWRSSLSGILAVIGNAKLIVSGGQTVSASSAGQGQ